MGITINGRNPLFTFLILRKCDIYEPIMVIPLALAPAYMNTGPQHYADISFIWEQ
jgi:hypothetical protein